MAKFRFEMCLFGGCINHSTFSSLPLHMSESAVDPGLIRRARAAYPEILNFHEYPLLPAVDP
jgi:hypothetical protein